MKMKNVLLGAMLAIGCGVGFNAAAVNDSLSRCCRVLQEECEYFNPPSSCTNVYNNCMASRRCFIP